MMKKLTKRFLLIVSIILMLSIIDGTEPVDAVTLLNMSKNNLTTNNNTSILNITGENSTALNTIDSIPEDDRSGSISSLPGKCLGSALCPD
jgi:hypothetical protein